MSRAGHGDHWLAALPPDDPRLRDALSVPMDAPENVTTHRRPLTEALDMVQITARRRLITAYPEPRAVHPAPLKPRELHLWDTHVEAWLVADHPDAGTLTLFLTDLVENAERYQKARGTITLDLGAIAYTAQRATEQTPDRLRPATTRDARFLPDDYWYEATLREIHPAGTSEVLELQLQGNLTLPTVQRDPTPLAPGHRAQGFLWLTARWPEEQSS